MTRNAIVDYFRKRKNAGTEPVLAAIEDETDQNAMKEATGWIGYYVNALPENYREALTLYEMKGLSQKEVADQLGISYVNARSRIQRGRQHLKRDLTDCCIFNVDVYGNIIEYESRPRNCSSC